MRKIVGFLLVLVFILGIASSSFGQDNQTEKGKDKKTTQEIWNNEVVDFSTGLNKVYVPFLTTYMGLNPYENRAWELELRTNFKSGFSSVHILEVYNLNDNNDFPLSPNEEVLDNWVASGRGYAYRYLMHTPSIRVNRFNSYYIFGGGFWLRHEAHRFKPIEKRDGYPLGVNMTAGYGLNLLLTKDTVVSMGMEFQMNMPKEIQLARFKVGLHYKSK